MTSRTRRRIGSARADNTSSISAECSLIAGSLSGDPFEVGSELTQGADPTLDVVRDGRGSFVLRDLEVAETALDDAEECTVAARREGELDDGGVAFAGFVLGEGEAAEGEEAGRFDALDNGEKAAMLLPVHDHLAAGAEVDLGAVEGEPGAKVFGFGQDRPDPLDRSGGGDLAFDLVGNHRQLSFQRATAEL